MDVEEKFVLVSGLVGEPARARMLWNLLDGRAYTAGELAVAADISASSASNHLAKLLEAGLLQVEYQGRHRYYSFSNPEVAYAVEALANLADHKKSPAKKNEMTTAGIKYCRSCYDHLAGFIGVSLTDTLTGKGYLKKSGMLYQITGKGWSWFSRVGIAQQDFTNTRRPLARQCLDWSERRPHLAGQLGAALLQQMLRDKWFRRVQFSRELVLTPHGRKQFDELLGISLP